MFQRCAVALIAQWILPIVLLVTAAGAAEPQDETVATFVLQFDLGQLPDLDLDGVPDLPDLQSDEFKLIHFEEQQNFGDLIFFSSTSPPCGAFEVAGTLITSDSTATLVHRGRPYSVFVYRQAYGVPPYRSTLLTSDILHTESCWAADNSYSQVRLQSQFDTDTSRCLAFVTARMAK